MRRPCRPGIALALVCLIGESAADAHHSRAPFLLDQKIELKGRITEVEWRSPHVYFQAAIVSSTGVEESWTFEGHSIPGFARVGWTRDSVQVGDRVSIVAHPNRDPEKKFAMLYSVTGPDGVVHYAYEIPEGKTVPGLPSRAPTAPSTDFAGTWRYVIPVREAALGSFHPPSDWPLTAEGKAQVAAWNVNDDPVLDCVPLGVPRLILAPYSHAWQRFDEEIVIEKERSPQVRVIHLDGAPRPAGFVPNELGYSLGHFEPDGALVVETDGFAPTRWGNARGLDSSAQKRVLERYRLVEGGYEMSVSYTIDDPEFLTEPVTVEGEYQKSSDYEFVDEPCDKKTARRFLEFQ